jgi:hypothetical protein
LGLVQCFEKALCFLRIRRVGARGVGSGRVRFDDTDIDMVVSLLPNGDRLPMLRLPDTIFDAICCCYFLIDATLLIVSCEGASRKDWRRGRAVFWSAGRPPWRTRSA